VWATATAIALGLAGLGLLAGRPGLSVLAAAAAGASLGFLRYTRPGTPLSRQRGERPSSG